MVRRPSNWNKLTEEEKMQWLGKQRKRYNGGRKVLLTQQDTPRVWSLFKKYENKSLVAEVLGVSRRTVIRFLDRHPIPEPFVLEESMSLTDFPEIRTWLKRMEGFANKTTISNYMVVLRQFYEYVKKRHPERAKPCLWTSDDISEFVYSRPKHLWHWAIVPLGSLALKAQFEFPNIDLGLLPTRRTHKAKRSLGGKEEYYLTPDQISAMIESARILKAKALIAFLYNTACRTQALTKVRIEDLHLRDHFVKIRDKGPITWMVYGLNGKACRLLDQYLRERGYPRTGWLFVNGKGNRLTKNQVNDIIREVGKKAGIKGKVLTAKTFRKSFVKNALEIAKVNLISLCGTGKGTKTCMCVGWTLDIIMKHYAPHLRTQIEQDRQKVLF